MAEPKISDRYPGIRSFEPEERDMFFGRDQEQDDLFALVKVSRLTVIFSKSGVGKTSMINAGLKPLLESSEYQPIPIRLQSTEETPVQILGKALEPFLKNSKIKTFHPKTVVRMWHWLRASEFPKRRTPVLIFDQFEEFFGHNAKAREEFVEQLADLVLERLPADVERQFYDIPLDQRTEEIMQWYTVPAVKVVLAIRSDRISELDEMSLKIPSILRDRYHLKPLSWEQARQAIVKPAGMEGNFSTKPFQFGSDTLEMIERHLKSKAADEIEPFQLQILCQEIELRVQNRDENNLVVTPDDLGGESGIALILNNYYEKQIAAFGSGEEQQLVRRLLEDELIADDKRIGVAIEKIRLNAELRERLLQTRLIRESDTHLGKVYELSHDNLIQPVLNTRNKREELEKQKAADAIRKLRQKEKERKIKAWAGYAILMTATTAISLNSYFQAETERKKAEYLAEDLRKKQDELETINDSLAGALENVKKLGSQLYIQSKYIQADEEKRRRQQHEKAMVDAQNYIAAGEEAMMKKRHFSAVQVLEKAEEILPPGHADLSQKIRHHLSLAYKSCGDSFKRDNHHQEALDYYHKSLEYVSADDPEEKKRIEDRIALMKKKLKLK